MVLLVYIKRSKDSISYNLIFLFLLNKTKYIWYNNYSKNKYKNNTEDKMSYQNDLTLITTSKEFRRMQDKTQLFYARKSDHYRTRLTHTLEVCDIALQIAERLNSTFNLNLDDKLITAISYGHDVGHTPFGHIGERVLSNILDGTDNLGGLIDTGRMVPQCFKHNINSFRVLTGEDYCNKKNKPLISWQVLDGILKHTDVFKTKIDYSYLGDIKDDPYQLQKAYLIGDLSSGGQVSSSVYNSTPEHKIVYHRLNNALTLEGQIVMIADEIAQRISDFDDAVRAGYWRPNIENFKKDQKILKFYIDNKNYFTNLNNVNVDKSVTVICNKLRKFLVEEVIYDSTKDEIHDLDGETKIHLAKCIVISNQNEGDDTNNAFDKINKEYVLRCKELRRCDGISKHVIRQLFKAYYNDISQLSDGCLSIIYKDVTNKIIRVLESANSDENDKHIIVGKKLQDIKKIRNVDLDQKVLFVKYLKLLNERKNIEKKEICVTFEHSVFLRLVLIELKREINGIATLKKHKIKDPDWQYKLRQELLKEINSIVIRDIAHFIAGMTDSFARDEYQRLYGIKMPMNTY